MIELVIIKSFQILSPPLTMRWNVTPVYFEDDFVKSKTFRIINEQRGVFTSTLVMCFTNNHSAVSLYVGH